MSPLDHPEAQALLADAVVTPDAVVGQADRLISFLQRYLPRFYRVEQRATAALVIRGRFGGLERKTSEPIAIKAGLPRKPIQFFVGAGKWDHEAVMADLRADVTPAMLANPGPIALVSTLYHEILNRAPEQSGEQYWLEKLAIGATPGQVARKIFTSPEHHSLQSQHLAPRISLRTALTNALSAEKNVLRINVAKPTGPINPL